MQHEKKSGGGVVSKTGHQWFYTDVKKVPKKDNSSKEINKLWFIWPAIIMAMVAMVVVLGER